jgi:hypothetical protein
MKLYEHKKKAFGVSVPLVLGSLVGLGILYVAVRSVPEMVRYLRIRKM